MQKLSELINRVKSGERNINKKLVLALLAISAVAAFMINSAISDSTVSSKAELASTIDSSGKAGGVSAISNDASGKPASEAKIVAPTVFVHVVGEVKVPGIYALESGARLVEAIVQAGGFTAKADQSSVNLARTLTDGEQIFILRPGAASNPGSGATFSGATATNGLISLNRGSQAELEELPGVGPTLAQRIIDWRAANGGFKNKLDLQNVAGIGDKMFAAIEPKVTL